MGKYRQGRKIFWAALALFLLVVAMPLSVAGVEYWNERIAGTDAIAYQMNNENATTAQPTENGNLYRIAAFTKSGTTLYQEEQSVFWNANQSWNEMIIQTNMSGAQNTSYPNHLYFNWNISAQELLNANVNKIIIKLKGINANVTTGVNIWAVNNGELYNTGINLLDINNVYAPVIKEYANNTTSVGFTIQLDPASLAYAAAHTTANNSRILIKIDGNPELFNEGQIMYFQIYATHPHGKLVWGSYGATEVILGIWTGIGFAVLFVTSPAWNPTTHSGLIEHVLKHHKYSRAAKSRRSSKKSRRTHHTHKKTHRRKASHRRRR